MAVLVTRGSATIKRLMAIRFQILAENRVIVGHVRADQQDHVGALHVFIVAGRAVASKRKLVAGNGRRHAQSRVAVEVVRTETELHEFAQRVEFLGDQLAGTEDAQSLGPVFRLHRAEALDQGFDRFVPANALQLAVPAQQRILSAIFDVDDVVFREALGAELAAIHLMRFQRPGCHGAPVFHPDLHAAADRTIAARRRHPAIRNAPRRRVAGGFAALEFVFLGQVIEPHEPFPIHGLHAACLLPEVNAAAMFLGTTLTKKR